jgi:uroporphyrin-3 C-methyltransferase
VTTTEAPDSLQTGDAKPLQESPSRGADRAAPTPRWLLPALLLLAAVAAAALGVAWNTQQRLRNAEQELARRQQETAGQSMEARTLARQAEAGARDSAAKVALMEARVAENSLQRSQLDELLQSLSRSRDENVLADVDAALRVAMQQSAITGSVEPLAAALRQTDERLARYQQPRLERVRRAALKDLDKVRSAAGVDVTTLSLRIDEIVRVVDELPLLAAVERRRIQREPEPADPRAIGGPRVAGKAGAPGAAASASATGDGNTVREQLKSLAQLVWAEVRSLARVTRIEDPQAVLLAPEQAWFLRENLKLRLLNARLALLSRQFDIAQADLRDAQVALERYFDPSSKRVQQAAQAARQAAAQARQVVVPAPDATLAAVAAAAAGR